MTALYLLDEVKIGTAHPHKEPCQGRPKQGCNPKITVKLSEIYASPYKIYSSRLLLIVYLSSVKNKALILNFLRIPKGTWCRNFS